MQIRRGRRRSDCSICRGTCTEGPCVQIAHVIGTSRLARPNKSHCAQQSAPRPTCLSRGFWLVFANQVRIGLMLLGLPAPPPATFHTSYQAMCVSESNWRLSFRVQCQTQSHHTWGNERLCWKMSDVRPIPSSTHKAHSPCVAHQHFSLQVCRSTRCLSQPCVRDRSGRA